MKTMNKALVAGAVSLTLAVASGLVLAKDGEREQNSGERFEYIFNQLELTETQRTDVLDVMQSYSETSREEMKARMEEFRSSSDERPSRDEMRAQMETYRAEQLVGLADQLNLVLSPEDTAELIEYLEAHMPKGMGQRGERSGEGRW